MRRYLTLSLAFILALVSVPPVLGQGKKGKNKVTVLETTPQDYQALAKMQGVSGRIISIDPATNRMTIRVEYQVAKSTGKFKMPRMNMRRNNYRPSNRSRRGGRYRRGSRRNNPAQLMRQYQQLMRIRNPIQRAQRMQQLMMRAQQQNQRNMVRMLQQQMRVKRQVVQNQVRAQQQMQKAIKNYQKSIKMETMAKEFTLAISDKARVARKSLGLEYDDKGNIKEYTPEQLKKMKDDKLPGYKAKMGDLSAGEMVYVYLVTPKGKDNKPKVAISDILGGAGGKSAPVAHGPVITAVMILSEADLSTLPQVGRRKKK